MPRPHLKSPLFFVFPLVCGLLLVLVFLSPAAQADDLDPVLQKTSQQASSFLARLSHVRCLEQVTQQKLDAAGHLQYTENGAYDYFILFHSGDDEMLLNESRVEVTRPGQGKKNVSLLLTNGFSTLFLIFHPYYRNSFRFAAEQVDAINGTAYLRVHFVAIPGTRSPAALAVRGREYPLQLTGTAWINPATGAVARIQAGLANDMQDVGVRSFSAEVEYAPVQLPGSTESFRLPVLATVSLETPRQHWSNVHRFTDYRRFGVDFKISMPEEGTSQ